MLIAKGPQFKVGQTVIYTNGNKLQLGVIKSIETDGRNGFNYYVNYHTGSTASCTSEKDLKALDNEYAFLIVRKSAESDIDSNPIRQMVAKILEPMPFENEDYYNLEDYITACLQGESVTFKGFDICNNPLKYVLKHEIIEYISKEWHIEDIENDLIEDILESLLKRFDDDCLNLNLIRSECNRKMTERKYLKCNQNLF